MTDDQEAADVAGEAPPPDEPGSSRPWYRRKGLLVGLLAAGAVVIALVAIGDGDDGGEDGPPDFAAPPNTLPHVRPDDPNRPDTRADRTTVPPSTRGPGGSPGRAGDPGLLDPERSDGSGASVGDTARLADYSATLVDASLDGETLVVAVVVENRDDDPQPYGESDWRLETEAGGVLAPAENPRADALGAGTLGRDERVEGTLVFDVGPGVHSLVYQPDRAGAARGVWTIEI